MFPKISNISLFRILLLHQKVSEYDQEITQSHITKFPNTACISKSLSEFKTFPVILVL